MAMGFTTADLANLKAALVSGALRVQIGDRLVIYRNQEEILKAIKMVQDELNGLPADPCSSPNLVRGKFRKNWYSE